MKKFKYFGFIIPKNNLQIIFFLILFSILFIIYLIQKNAMLSFSEIFNPDIKKIERKVDLLSKKGYKSNITYLYFDGSKEDIKRNIEVFKDIVDFLDKKYYKEKDIFKRGKVSIKMSQLGFNKKEIMDNLIEFLNYAKYKNILIWISAFHHTHTWDECMTYISLFERGYTNIGITIACYHKKVDKYVNLVLNKGGHIRLVKGYYNDGEIKDWDIVTQNYYRNALKIIKSPQYHQLATHDFEKVLAPLNKIIKLENLYNKEFGFFINSIKHVEREMKKYNINLPNKCILITFGKKFKHLKTNFNYINFKRLLRIKNII